MPPHNPRTIYLPITTLPQRIQPAYARSIIDLPKPPPAKKGKRPQIVPGKVAPAVQSLIPAPVIQIMKDGWGEYIPLTALTDDFCHKFSHSHTSYVLQVDAKNRTIFKNSLNLPENDEYHMKSPQWVQAWKHMSALIEQYTPHLAETWARHYNNIIWHITFDAEFKIWLRYDIQVRPRSLEEDLDPAVFQAHIHKEVERQFLLANRDSALADSSTRRRSASPPPPKSNRQTAVGTSSSDQSHATCSSARSANNSDTKCFICGGTGHIPRNCSAPTRHNGKPLLCVREGKFIKINNDSFCYNFNGAKGCYFSECTRGPHLCSLCGDTNHNAQSCRN